MVASGTDLDRPIRNGWLVYIDVLPGQIRSTAPGVKTEVQYPKIRAHLRSELITALNDRIFVPGWQQLCASIWTKYEPSTTEQGWAALVQRDLLKSPVGDAYRAAYNGSIEAVFGARFDDWWITELRAALDKQLEVPEPLPGRYVHVFKVESLVLPVSLPPLDSEPLCLTISAGQSVNVLLGGFTVRPLLLRLHLGD